MSRSKMSTWTLGAIMLIVPTSFYLGTALNRHYAFNEPAPSLPSSSGSFSEDANAKEEAPPAVPTTTSKYRPSSADELAMLQSRYKSLKTSRNALEMELKDNREKLRRLEERMKKEADKQAAST